MLSLRSQAQEAHVLSDFLSMKRPEQQIHADRQHSAVIQGQEEGVGACQSRRLLAEGNTDALNRSCRWLLNTKIY